MTSKKLADYLSNLILDKKGTDITILDLRKLTAVSDYFIVCTASSDLHAKAIADYLVEESKKEGERAWHNEGYKSLNWVLIDFVNVVVHVFREESRRFYNLEALWGDAKIKRVE